MTERRILCRDLTPHIPAAAFFDFLVESSRFILTADRRIFHAAAVRDEHQIVFCQVDGIFLALCDEIDTRCPFLASATVEFHIDDLNAVVELHAEALEVLHHRQDHGFILIIFGETQSCEVRQSTDMVNVTLDIELHLQCAVPVFKREHGSPVQPEVGIQYLIVKDIRDTLILQILIRREEQIHDLHRALIRDRKLAVRVCILSAINRRSAQRIVRILFVQPVIFIQH